MTELDFFSTRITDDFPFHFSDYMDLAAKSGIVIMGGGTERPGLKVKTEPWIAMKEDFVTAGF